MIRTGTDRLQQIADSANKDGIDKTAERFGLSRSTIDRYLRLLRSTPKSKAKVLFLDTETAPNIGLIWQAYKTYVSPQQIQEHWFMMCWAARWADEEQMMSSVLTYSELKKNNDARIMRGLWKLLDEADVVIAHNADGFDIRSINTRFLFHRMPPPAPYTTIDTLKHVRRICRLASNALDAAAKFFGTPRKMEHRPGLHIACLKGEPGSLEELCEYCEHDVIALQHLYLVLRPYMRNHPNLGLLADADRPICPACGSHLVAPSGHTVMKRANLYPVYRCSKCGYNSHSASGSLDLDRRRAMLRG